METVISESMSRAYSTTECRVDDMKTLVQHCAYPFMLTAELAVYVSMVLNLRLGTTGLYKQPERSNTGRALSAELRNTTFFRLFRVNLKNPVCQGLRI